MPHDWFEPWNVGSQIAGYRIAITLQGSLPKDGTRIVHTPNHKRELQSELDAMASWYLVEVIAKDPSRFERFKL